MKTIIVCLLLATAVATIRAEGVISRGMGRSGFTEPNNTISIAINPALLAYSQTADLSFDYMTTDDISIGRYDIAWAGMLKSEKIGAGLCVEYDYLPSESVYLPRSYVFSIPLCYRIYPYLSVGVTPHLLYSQQYAATPFRELNAHISVMGDIAKKISIAVGLENLRDTVHTERALLIGVKNDLIFSMPIYYSYTKTLSTKQEKHSIGIEYRMYPYADIRVGFNHDPINDNADFFSLGATWYVNPDICISYAYENNGPGHTELHSIGVKLIDFDFVNE